MRTDTTLTAQEPFVLGTHGNGISTAFLQKRPGQLAREMIFVA